MVKGFKGSIQGSVHQKPGLEYLSSRYIKIHMNLLYLVVYLFQVPNEHLKIPLPFVYWLWRACKQVKCGLKRDQKSLQDSLSLLFEEFSWRPNYSDVPGA